MSLVMSRSLTSKPVTAEGTVPPVRNSEVSATAPPVSDTTGASLTGTIVSAIVRSAGTFETLPLPTSPPMREPLSSTDMRKVTSPAAVPLRSLLTFKALW